MEDRWVGGIHLKVFNFFKFTSVHAKKVMVTEGNTTTPGIHGPQHEAGSELIHTHGTVKGLRALGFGSRGPVLAHTQTQSHTSTVHGTRGHLNTWSR